MDVVRNILSVTTQLVPSLLTDTREIMRDHLKIRTHGLKYKRINDRLFVDALFSLITLVRGHSCWNLHSYEESQLDVVLFRQRRTQDLANLKKYLSTTGVPHIVHSENAKEFTPKK